MKVQPRTLLVIDGFGALLSAFLLGVVLVRFSSVFGMPINTLYLLAALPVGFAVYDFAVLGLRLRPLSPWLRGIALANWGYCVLSIILLFQHAADLASWGWAYFVGELIIVASLAGLEWQVARKSTETD